MIRCYYIWVESSELIADSKQFACRVNSSSSCFFCLPSKQPSSFMEGKLGAWNCYRCHQNHFLFIFWHFDCPMQKFKYIHKIEMYFKSLLTQQHLMDHFSLSQKAFSVSTIESRSPHYLIVFPLMWIFFKNHFFVAQLKSKR